MLYRHWLLLCFPANRCGEVQFHVGQHLPQDSRNHAVCNVAGAGTRPLHPLLQSASGKALLLVFCRRELDYPDEVGPIWVLKYCLFLDELNAEVFRQVSHTYSTDDDVLGDICSDYASVDMWEVSSSIGIPSQMQKGKFSFFKCILQHWLPYLYVL